MPKFHTTKLLGRLLGSLLAILLFQFTMPLIKAYAAPTPPRYTTSYYMNTNDPASLPTAAYNLGCTLGTSDRNTAGTQDNVVILLFGKPVFSSNTYGTYVWTARGSASTVFMSTSQIASTVQQFAKGYWICTGTDTTSQLYLAAGTSNFGNSTNVNYNHGSAWATMTKNINSWVSTNGYSSQVKIRAASDIEPDFSNSSSAINWVNGYTASYGSGLWLYNVGAASGCPISGTPTANSACNNSWTVDNVWYVSWGTVPLYPIPEIYNTTGANASQWYRISLYSYLYKGGSMYFPGTLTQSQACQQMGGCSGVNNSPGTGWSQLWDAINTDSRTAGNIRWSTDIKWR